MGLNPISKIFNSRIIRLFITLQAVIAMGTLGWMVIEKQSFLDSLYMTIITMTTIGYSEIFPLSETGRWFNLLMIGLGVGSFMYIISQIAEGVMEKGINDFFLGTKKMKKQIEDLHDHVILCGFGQMGEKVAGALKKKKTPLVIIEKNPQAEARLKELGYLYLIGPAENDQILLDAGIKKARALITSVTSDAENVFITLSARSLNKDLSIVARAIDDSSTPKLLKAGASKVVSPYAHAGIKMASAILNPGVDTFLEVVASDNILEIQMADVLVGQDSPYLGLTLSEAQEKFQEKNLMLVGIKREHGNIELAHKAKGQIQFSDRLIVLGEEL